MSGFPWSEIRDGFNGFEQLAFEYVKNAYPQTKNWQKTKQTRDGNKDAVAIIVGYRQDGSSDEQWWMEAKYSIEKKILSRYRLDATIVSAVLSENVSKIVFVTNIIVESKTISDIKRAIESATICRDIQFCTKYNLEYWLLSNKRIFKKFFPKHNVCDYTVEDSVIIDNIQFYSVTSKFLTFTEPVKELFTGVRYFATLSLFSAKSKILSIKPNKKLKGLIIHSNTKVPVSAGTSQISLEIEFSEEICEQYDKLNVPILQIGKHNIFPKYSLPITWKYTHAFELPSQTTLLKEIKNSIHSFNKKTTAIELILGPSGVGKSFLLDQILPELSMQSVFYGHLTCDDADNKRLLAQCLLFILYPYLDPKNIDMDYILEISQKKYISKFITNVVKNLDDYDALHRLMDNVSEQENIFPPAMIINSRYIILDDIQKIDTVTGRFLWIILKNSREFNIPLFIILSGQPSFTTNPNYKKILEFNALKKYQLQLSLSDIIHFLSIATNVDMKYSESMMSILFDNVIQMFLFIQFLNDVKKLDNIKSTNDIIVEYRMFTHSTLARQYILNKFNEVFEKNVIAKDLCNQIYWSLSGVLLNESDHEIEYAVRLLLQFDLIKYSDDLKLIPYHDIYSEIYKLHFSKKRISRLMLSDNELDNINIQLNFGEIDQNIVTIISKIENLVNAGKFYSILYLLESIFETEESIVENKLVYGDAIYYKLYYFYSLGVTNTSRTKSGKEVFQKIADETKYVYDIDVSQVRADVIWELINSNFEWLDFTAAKKWIIELNDLIKRMQIHGHYPNKLDRCENHLNVLSIEMLILSENNVPCAKDKYKELRRKAQGKKFDYLRCIIDIRYAQTLYQRNIKEAIALLNITQNKLKKIRGEDDKFYLWSCFDHAFLQTVNCTSGCMISDVIKFHNMLKDNYYNDYRKKFFGIAAYYYMVGDQGMGDKYLFLPLRQKRDLRPRQKAFYYQTLALHELLQGRHLEAVKSYRNSLDILSNFDSYSRIIKHNIRQIDEYGIPNFQFLFTDNMDEQIIYIDPRCIW